MKRGIVFHQNRRAKWKCRRKRISPSISAIPIRSQRVMRLIFSSPTSTFHQLVKDRICGNTYEGGLAALKWQGRNYHETHTWPSKHIFVLIYIFVTNVREVLLQFAARSALIGSSKQMLHLLLGTHSTRTISVYMKHIRYQMRDACWKRYVTSRGEDIAGEADVTHENGINMSIFSTHR